MSLEIPEDSVHRYHLRKLCKEQDCGTRRETEAHKDSPRYMHTHAHSPLHTHTQLGTGFQLTPQKPQDTLPSSNNAEEPSPTGMDGHTDGVAQDETHACLRADPTHTHAHHLCTRAHVEEQSQKTGTETPLPRQRHREWRGATLIPSSLFSGH